MDGISIICLILVKFGTCRSNVALFSAMCVKSMLEPDGFLSHGLGLTEMGQDILILSGHDSCVYFFGSSCRRLEHDHVSYLKQLW